jgi:hypothetical protein
MMSRTPKPRSERTSTSATSRANASRAGTAPAAAPRIVGNPVPPLLPARGPIHVLLVGEAPGPRGADKSGVPFFGDAAGQHLYAALRDIGAVTLPAAVDDLPWDGEIFADGGLVPTAHGIALGNAYDRCPTDDFLSFRTPSRAELASNENVARLVSDIERFEARGLRGIVTMGRVATTTIDLVLKRVPHPALVRRAVVHPSARGLLSMLPGRGTGTKMVALQAKWKVMCEMAVREAGFPG